MKTIRTTNLCLLITLFLTFSVNAQEWNAGVAKAVITPQHPMPMAGYASRGAEHAHGTLIDIWAKALVLQTGEQAAAIITLDLVGIDRGLAESITQELQKKLNWQRSQIAICTSHTHTGPVVAKNLRPMHYMLLNEDDRRLVDDYANFVQKTVVNLVLQAHQDLKPSTLKWGSGTATFATNRRTNVEKNVPQLRSEGALKGPSDHDVPVLCVEQNGEIKSILFGYACHCTTLSSFEWSGDYAGFAQMELEQIHPGCVAMFWAGCGGDQNPLPRRTVELAKEYGGRLADAVDKALSGDMKIVSPEISTRYREIDLKLAPLPDKAKLEQEAASSNIYLSARAKSLLHQLESDGRLASTYPYPISLWTLGKDVNFVFLGGEVVVDYALRIKEELGSKMHQGTNVWCAAYSNDVMAYIPSLRVLSEGGYEGGGAMIYYGLPTVWAPEVEMDIISTVHDLAGN